MSQTGIFRGALKNIILITAVVHEHLLRTIADVSFVWSREGGDGAEAKILGAQELVSASVWANCGHQGYVLAQFSVDQ